MMRIILLMLVISSCTAQKDSFLTDKTDYLVYGNDKYITTNIDVSTKVVNAPSTDKFIIKNEGSDTMYVFSTVLINPYMFYSKENVGARDNIVHLHSYYKNFIKDASNSGIKKFNFFRILPKDSVIVNFDKERTLRNLGADFKFKNAVFDYYYFTGEGAYAENGLYNISKFPLKKASVRQSH